MRSLFKNIILSLRKSKTSMLLNILGLSVAFGVFSVVLTQVCYEFGFNRSIANYERMGILQLHNHVDGSTAPYISNTVAEAIGEQIPDIEASCYLTIYPGFEQTFYTQYNSSTDKHFFKLNLIESSAGFLDVFKPEIVEGDAKLVFANPENAMISQSDAQRLFGKNSPINKLLHVDETKSYKVVAVYKDFKKNTSLSNGIYVKSTAAKNLGNWNFLCYVVTKDKNADFAAIAKKLKNVYVEGKNLEKLTSEGQYSVSFLPFKDLYFSGVKENSTASEQGNRAVAYTLLVIGLLVLIIAFINFVNFATALAPTRIKGINTFRVMGASRASLQRSILFESALTAFFSFLISILWIKLLVSTPVAEFFDAPLSPSENVVLLSLVGLGSILLGALAGIYPAFYMTSFSPALVLKGTFALSPKGRALRNGLLTFQFAISILLIAVAISVNQQNIFLRNYSVGYDKENILSIKIPQQKNGTPEWFMQELKKNPLILDIATTAFLPGNILMGWGREIEGQTVQFKVWPVGENFLKFFNIRLLEGSNFVNHHDSAVNKVIVNKAFVEKYKMKNVVGKRVMCFSNMGDICGVANDINFASLKTKVEPMMFVCGSDQFVNYILVKMSGKDVPSTLDYIKSTFRTYSEEEPEISFVDDTLRRLYQREENLSNAITLFCIITIIISLLGVYGLVVFNTKYKTKEIAIRKVNGATEMEVIRLLSGSFIKMLTVAFVVSTPLAYWIVSRWLAGFAYSVGIQWWAFAAAGIVTFVVTVATVYWQTRKAALVNPILSLRNE